MYEKEKESDERKVACYNASKKYHNSDSETGEKRNDIVKHWSLLVVVVVGLARADTYAGREKYGIFVVAFVVDADARERQGADRVDDGPVVRARRGPFQRDGHKVPAKGRRDIFGDGGERADFFRDIVGVLYD